MTFNPFESAYRLVPARAESASSTAKLTTAAGLFQNADTIDFKEAVQNFEIDLIKQAMKQSQFNQKKAAEQLNLSYHQLRGYLRKYGLLG